MISSLWRGLVRTLAAFGALVGLVTVAPPRWYARTLAGAWPDARESVLIVLGGGVLDNGMLGDTSYLRSIFAVITWKGGAFRRLILSGDRQTTGPMRDFIVCQGVPADAIVVEDQSTSTRENALYTAELARGMTGPFVLLTSDYHAFRASRAFAKVGLQVTSQPFSDALKRSNDWRERWRVCLDLAQESIKIAYYLARGWI